MPERFTKHLRIRLTEIQMRLILNAIETTNVRTGLSQWVRDAIEVKLVGQEKPRSGNEN
jgi:hypothetical protein